MPGLHDWSLPNRRVGWVFCFFSGTRVGLAFSNLSNKTNALLTSQQAAIKPEQAGGLGWASRLAGYHI
jgi:hypothetical protein